MENVTTTLKKNKEGYGYKYTELAEIHRYLEENNMKYYQEIETDQNGNDYILTYRYIDNKWEDKPKRGCRVVDAVLAKVDNPAQEQGSALTYARRYSLLMAFGLATEDNDASSLSRPKNENKISVEKASEKQVSILERTYKGDDLKKLLELNNIEKLEDITKNKASELISKIMG